MRTKFKAISKKNLKIIDDLTDLYEYISSQWVPYNDRKMKEVFLDHLSKSIHELISNETELQRLYESIRNG